MVDAEEELDAESGPAAGRFGIVGRVLRSRRFQNTVCGFLGALVGVVLSAAQIDDSTPERKAQIQLRNVPVPIDGLEGAAGPSSTVTTGGRSAIDVRTVPGIEAGDGLPDPKRVFPAFLPTCAPEAVGASGSYRYRNTGYWLEGEERTTYPDDLAWTVQVHADGDLETVEPRPGGRTVRTELHAGEPGGAVVLRHLSIDGGDRPIHFTPATPFTLMELRDGAAWTSTASDAATGTVAAVNGRVVAREQVRACGRDIRAYRVEVTFRLLDALGAVILESGVTQPDNHLVTGGGIVLRRFVDTSTTTAGVTTRLVAFSALESVK